MNSPYTATATAPTTAKAATAAVSYSSVSSQGLGSARDGLSDLAWPAGEPVHIRTLRCNFLGAHYVIHDTDCSI